MEDKRHKNPRNVGQIQLSLGHKEMTANNSIAKSNLIKNRASKHISPKMISRSAVDT